jgi:hypothetical protein
VRVSTSSLSRIFAGVSADGVVADRNQERDPGPVVFPSPKGRYDLRLALAEALLPSKKPRAPSV